MDLVNLPLAAKKITPDNSAFLTHIIWGLWRLVVKRSILTVEKFFPFRDEGILEWKGGGRTFM